MELSVAYTFAPDLMPRLAAFPEVREVYGKMDRDVVGGGRSSYTLRRTGRSAIRRAVRSAHEHGIEFNYLVNGAGLGGIEQTRAGQRSIRRLLDFLADIDVDAVTVASPLLGRIIRSAYPQFKMRVSAFAMVSTPAKANQWEDLGADTICVSAIAANRDFERLQRLRESVSCRLQLIVNASCLLECAWEPTHMQVLTQSSRRGDASNGFCLDYCVLQCSRARLRDPVNFIRACWIRPEDLHVYEQLGYQYFKILERSCPTDLLLTRVGAYVARRFDGNLYELVGPMATINRKLEATLAQRMRMIMSMFRPHKVKLSSLLAFRDYMNAVIVHDYSAESAPIYMDNRALDGFLEQVRGHGCRAIDCESCGVCRDAAEAALRVDPTYRQETLSQAETLNDGLESGALWW